MKVSSFRFKTALIAGSLISVSYLQLNTAMAAADVLTLQQAEQLALNNEPGLQGLQAKTQSMMSQSVANSQLMDPKIQLGLLNLPTDTFDFNQEPMTQLKLSYIQQFPAGDTREIHRQKAVIQSQQFQSRAQERKLTILKQVRLSYLELQYWLRARQTITKNQQLLSQLVEFVQSLFSVGKNNQLDVLTVQLQLSKLEDRLTKIEQNISTQRLKLSRWIGNSESQREISIDLPSFAMAQYSTESSDLIQLLANHPKIIEINTTLDITRKDIQIVEESKKPAWNLNVSYAYRDDAPSGADRADFLSAVVTVDLPLFTESRQDKKRLSREYDLQSSKDQRNAELRKMLAELSQLRVNQELLEKRQQLFIDKLIPQSDQRSQAALQSYQSGKGPFSGVIQAYMDALNMQLDEQRIAIDRLQTQANIQYLLVQN